MEKNNKKLWWQEDPSWKEVQEGIFEIEYESERKGVVPYTYGITIKVKDPRVEIYFDVGNDVITVSSGGLKRVFNCICGVGKHPICILGRTSVRDPEKKWRRICFDIVVTPRKDDPKCIIVNFFQSKAGGQMAKGATGLDVTFSLALREKPDSIHWWFGDGQERKEDGPKAATLLSVSNTYKTIGSFNGWVTVAHKGIPCTHNLNAIHITDLGF